MPFARQRPKLNAKLPGGRFTNYDLYNWKNVRVTAESHVDGGKVADSTRIPEM